MKKLQTGFMFILLAVLIFSCAGTRPFDFGNAEIGYRLTYRSQPGDVYHYQYHLETVNVSERGGRSFESLGYRDYHFHINAEKPDSLLDFLLTVDSLSYYYQMQDRRMDFDYGEIKGKRARLTVTPSGEIRSITAVDSIPRGRIRGRTVSNYGGSPPVNQLRPPLFVIPDRLLKPGNSWTESRNDTTVFSDTTRNIQRTTILDEEAEYQVIGVEKRHDFQCLHIRANILYSRYTTGEYSGNPMSSEGEGERVTDTWFAFEQGILVEYRLNDFFEGTTAMSGFTSPRSNESRVSLVLADALTKNKPSSK